MTNPSDAIRIYVDLPEEGSPTLITAEAVPLENGLFEILPSELYDPEDAPWMFIPGMKVRLVEHKIHGGSIGMLAVHPDPEVIEIRVESDEEYALPCRQTHAKKLGDGLYEVLATPHYTPEQLWKFPPGSIVRLKEVWPNIRDFPNYSYMLAVER